MIPHFMEGLLWNQKPTWRDIWRLFKGQQSLGVYFWVPNYKLSGAGHDSLMLSQSWLQNWAHEYASGAGWSQVGRTNMARQMPGNPTSTSLCQTYLAKRTLLRLSPKPASVSQPAPWLLGAWCMLREGLGFNVKALKMELVIDCGSDFRAPRASRRATSSLRDIQIRWLGSDAMAQELSGWRFL